VGLSQRGEHYDEKDKDFPKRIKWAVSVKKRYKNTCQVCGKKDLIEAHHILPWKSFVDNRLDLENGIAVCENCHNIIHSFIGVHSLDLSKYPDAINNININNLNKELQEEHEDRYT